MIHRTYITQLNLNGGDALLPVDIIVALPGSRLAPVLDPNAFPNVPFTAAPADWITACGTNWYYELRGRALRLETRSGTNGFVPRTNLGYHISVTMLQTTQGLVPGVSVPGVILSASLAAAPVAYAALDSVFATPFADPSYGPVIRIWPAGLVPGGGPQALKVGDAPAPALAERRPGESAPIYQIDFLLQESKDEDFTSQGHA
jgi:hypothetical protein